MNLYEVRLVLEKELVRFHNTRRSGEVGFRFDDGKIVDVFSRESLEKRLTDDEKYGIISGQSWNTKQTKQLQ